MAKSSNLTQNRQPQQEMPQPQQREPPPRYVFRMSWLLFVLSILGMWYLLSHIQSVLEWDQVMDFLNVHNRERYTRLAVLCLTLILIVAAVRIIGGKDNE